MKNVIILVLCLNIISGCSNDDKDNPYNGDYILESLISNMNLDLNNDGIQSNNILIELQNYFNLVPPFHLVNHLRIKPFIGDPHIAIFDHRLPKSSINYVDSEIVYISQGSQITIYFDKNLSKINSFDSHYSIQEHLNNNWAILEEIKIINENKIYAKFRHSFFSFDNGWKNVILEAVFIKKV